MVFDKNKTFWKSFGKKQKIAASLKRLKWGLGLSIHIEMLLILKNILYDTLLVLTGTLYRALYCPAYSPMVALLGLNTY